MPRFPSTRLNSSTPSSMNTDNRKATGAVKEHLPAELVATEASDAIVCIIRQRAQPLVIVSLNNNIPGQQADLSPELQVAPFDGAGLAEMRPGQEGPARAVKGNSAVCVSRTDPDVAKADVGRCDDDLGSYGPSHRFLHGDLGGARRSSAVKHRPGNLRFAVDVQRAFEACNNLRPKGGKINALRVSIEGDLRILLVRLKLRADLEGSALNENVCRRDLDVHTVEDELALDQNQIEPRQARVDKNHLPLWNHDRIRATWVVKPGPTACRRCAAAPSRSCRPCVNVGVCGIRGGDSAAILAGGDDHVLVAAEKDARRAGHTLNHVLCRYDSDGLDGAREATEADLEQCCIGREKGALDCNIGASRRGPTSRFHACDYWGQALLDREE
eukprot:3114816-Rhodomonas_salina.4